jgi:hypothetical protein
MTINEIQGEMRARGSHWWDPEAMRFFRCIVDSNVYEGPGGVYFVSSEKGPHGPRAYTVRKYEPSTRDIATHSELGEFATLADARDAAQEAASADAAGAIVSVSTTPHAPVKVAEQVRADILAHGGKMPTTRNPVEALIARAKLHHGLCEDQCNGTNQCRSRKHDQAPEDCPACDGTGVHGMGTIRKQLREQAADMGCGVRFSGDPRGCTVRLILPDGFTNDWGHEGYCVPTTTA